MKPELAEHGIGVSILFPGPVKSRIHETIENRPEHLRAESGFMASEKKLSRRIVGGNWMEPTEVGNLVADGILANSTYLVTHGFFKDGDARASRGGAGGDAGPGRDLRQLRQLPRRGRLKCKTCRARSPS